MADPTGPELRHIAATLAAGVLSTDVSGALDEGNFAKVGETAVEVYHACLEALERRPKSR